MRGAKQKCDVMDCFIKRYMQYYRSDPDDFPGLLNETQACGLEFGDEISFCFGLRVVHSCSLGGPACSPDLFCLHKIVLLFAFREKSFGFRLKVFFFLKHAAVRVILPKYSARDTLLFSFFERFSRFVCPCVRVFFVHFF